MKNKLAGQTFNSLTVLDVEPVGSKSLCRCVCGNQVWVRHDNLKAGRTKSCGCMRTSPTPEDPPTEKSVFDIRVEELKHMTKAELKAHGEVLHEEAWQLAVAYVDAELALTDAIERRDAEALPSLMTAMQTAAAAGQAWCDHNPHAVNLYTGSVDTRRRSMLHYKQMMATPIDPSNYYVAQLDEQGNTVYDADGKIVWVPRQQEPEPKLNDNYTELAMDELQKLAEAEIARLRSLGLHN